MYQIRMHLVSAGINLYVRTLCSRNVCTRYQPEEIYTYRYVRYVPPVDAHVSRQLHLSAVARCSDSYCIFLLLQTQLLYDRAGHLLVLHNGQIQDDITPPVLSCKLLIYLHPTRVIAINTKTTHLSSLGHGGCMIDVDTYDNVGHLQQHGGLTRHKYVTPLLSYISRLSNVLSNP